MINSIGKVSGEVKNASAEKTVSVDTSSAKLSAVAEENVKSSKSSINADVEVLLSGREQGNIHNQSKDGKNKEEFNEEDVKEISQALTEFMSKLNTNLEFDYYEKLGRFAVKMIDKQTKEVIKEFPPEKILEAMEKTREWIGLILDKKAWGDRYGIRYIWVKWLGNGYWFLS